MEISLLPKLKPGSTKEDFNEWLTEFSTFVDIIVKEEDKNTTGLKFLKYSIATSKLIISFDGHATFKSALDKIKLQFKTQNKSVTPLKDFYECKWVNTNLTFAQYIMRVETYAEFIDNKTARDRLVFQHCIEQFKPEFQIIFRKHSMSDLIEAVSQLAKENICEIGATFTAAAQSNERSHVTCHNCLRSGHYSTQCKQRKSKCSKCNNFGHQAKYCRSSQKNARGAILLVDQTVPTELPSTQ